ncbi:MAG: FtsX-like permease family protein [Methylobacteriaceae bacterium]|nr:FtsX-like permease family protein [Methylobacteriaceae bacterium]
MRGQVMTISLVIAAGVAVFVASISTYDSLLAGRDGFYLAGRMPQLFVTLKRAPLSILPQIDEIPGVAAVQARIVRDVIVDRRASPLPVSARIVSIDSGGDEPLARLHVRRGMAPPPGDAASVAINEAFAEANGVSPGEDMRVMLNSRVQTFKVAAVALSPEFVYAVKPGLPIPDDRLYAIIWMDRHAAEAAFDLKAAFNDLLVSLAPGADAQSVIAELDRRLEPYGSAGAVERRDQPSNRFLEDELNQQKVMSVTIPFVFFAVAAFLLNVTLGRLVAAQREQIAALKAMGFAAFPLAAHYLKLVAIIVLLASLLGIPAGFAFGAAMVESYRGFFRLPDLAFRITPWSVAAAVGASFAMAAVGVLSALRRVTVLAPAVAMRPDAPIAFRRSWIEGLIAPSSIRPHRMMILRNVAGRPLRTALTVIGVAFAVPMVVLGLFWRDAIDHMVDVQFNLVERGNVSVVFRQPVSRAIIGDLSREPGVLAVESQRIVPVRFRAGHRAYLTSVVGLPDRSELRRPHDAALRPIEVSSEGIVLTRRLAERLDVKAGDAIAVEVMEGARRKRDLPVSAVVDETIGMGSYMPITALNHLAGESDLVSAAVLYADSAAMPALSERFKNLPMIESVTVKSYTLASFMDKIANLVLVGAGVLTLFGVIIAVGVVYNSARIGLQERARELASLRVLGFTRAEVARILFAEFALEIGLGVPLGLAASQGLIGLIARFHSNESFQIPGVIGAQTYAVAALVVIASALASAYVVRRRIDQLDLVSVLKTRD